MDAAQYPGSTQLFSMAGGKSDIKLHKLLLLRCCWLLLPGCWCGHPITTLDIRQKHIFPSVHIGQTSEHTGYSVCSLAYPVCTLGRKSARFQCANWARLPVYTLDTQCAHWTSNVYTGICVLAGCNICPAIYRSYE